MRGVNRPQIDNRGAVLPCLELDRRFFHKAGLVNFRVVDILAKELVIEKGNEVERSGDLTIDERRLLDATLRGGIFFRKQKSAELDPPRAFADHGTECFDGSQVNEPDSLRGVVSTENISSVVGRHKVGDSEVPARLSSGV